jgi:hypothetical protein
MENKPWHLKTPVHVLYLPEIRAVFPDARFVMTHRDPTDVLLSLAELHRDIFERFTDNVDYRYIGASIVEVWTTAMDRVLQFRAELGDALFYDVDFKAMQSDPIGQVRGLYGWLGEPVVEEFETRMTSWWTQSQESRETSVRGDPALYGMNMDLIRARFSDYTTHAERWTRATKVGG